MRKVFSDTLKRQLRPLFMERFPEFEPYKPKQSPEEKEKFPLPMATDYFRRIRGPLWEIIGIRRYTRDEWTMEILWSTQARFPSSRLNRDGGRQNLDELVKLPEAHTDVGTIVGKSTDWPVWTCSVPYDHPEYLKRYVIESIQPVAPDIAERKVVEQLNATSDVIENFILPWFSRIEEQHSASMC